MTYTRKLLKALFFSLFLIGLMVFTAYASPALEVKINDKATVKGDFILLGDVASFSPETDPRIPGLANLDLGASPYPGQTLALNSRYLVFRLNANLSSNKDIQIKLPEVLLVSRTAQFVESSDMEQIFKNHILKNSPWPSRNISFEGITTPGRLALPEGCLDWEIRPRTSADYIGNVHLVLTFRVDGNPIRKVSLFGRVRVRQEVLRAARNLRPGEVIGREDISMSTEEMTYIPKQTLLNPDEIIGQRVVRTIRADQFITDGMVEDPPLIKKGDRVMIRAENDRILITTIGQALEDGRTGDRVKVVNVSSGKEVLATVKGPELVEVSF